MLPMLNRTVDIEIFRNNNVDSDNEGNQINTLDSVVKLSKVAWGSPNNIEVSIAGKDHQQVEKVFLLPTNTNILLADVISTAEQKYVVVKIMSTGFHLRVFVQNFEEGV